MSTKYPGGFITKSPTAPTSTAAPGVWTLEQQAQYQKAGTWPFGGPFTYIEDVFSTYLYTGNGSTQTITNGIDLAGKGGLVWAKTRSNSSYHGLSGPDFSTSYFGGYGGLRSNGTNALGGTDFTGVTSTGFNLAYVGGDMNYSGYTYASWTFRKQPKFFDIVTYTGNGTARTIAHNLGSTPGCIIVKNLTTASDWRVYHRGLTSAEYDIRLNLTNAQASVPSAWNSTAPTSTVFSLGANTDTNGSGDSFVAYLDAHNAGGFGLTGADNVISCGSFTTDGGGVGSATLGYEPQWVMVKSTSTTGAWVMLDTMRGLPTSGTNCLYLQANASTAETSGSQGYINSTGFGVNLQASTSYIYIAIRRGPMKVPTTGTSVFSPVTQTGAGTVTTNFPVDFVIAKDKTQVTSYLDIDRLRGSNLYLIPNLTTVEQDNGSPLLGFNNSNVGYADFLFTSGQTPIYWNFRRAPGFFDEVCYTGTGSATTITHNLGAVPELIIVKRRSGSETGGVAGYWVTYSATLGNTKNLFLNTTDSSQGASVWNSTSPTSTVFTVNNNYVNYSSDTYVAYLFATCAGVSKVGSYTGTGATQTISCGFTGGARFVLIKRTDSTGDWYVWDTARGMVAGTDPSLLLNSTAAEVNANSIYTTTGGFQIVSTASGINASGGTYIYLAIA